MVVRSNSGRWPLASVPHSQGWEIEAPQSLPRGRQEVAYTVAKRPALPALPHKGGKSTHAADKTALKRRDIRWSREKTHAKAYLFAKCVATRAGP